LGVVPETTHVVGPDGEYLSLQDWKENTKVGTKVNSPDKVNYLSASKGTFLDMLSGNEDRHDGNWLLTEDGDVWAIDNGLGFTSTDTDVGSINDFWRNTRRYVSPRPSYPYLPHSYRDTLAESLADGSYEKILKTMNAKTIRAQDNEALVNAGMERARKIVDDWDELFIEHAEET
jgi:hypothetical protein